MLRFSRTLCLGLLSVALLIYASAFGFGVCLGLMTWDLPMFVKPILLYQPAVAASAALIVPYVAWEKYRKGRNPIIFVGGLAATIWICCWPLLRVMWPIREQGLEQSAVRMSTDLVGNLEKYRRENGVYPATLKELGVPIETGMVSYSHLRYRRADAQTPFKGYEIRVRTGYGLNFDSFFYWPSEKYPAQIYGGSTEIIKAAGHKWAYVHE